MAELARQLLHLIIAAVPTAVIVFLFYLFARPVFFKPIVRVLEERARRTEGARARAGRLEASAEEKLAAYRRALDKVRAGIYAEREAARHAALEERSNLLRESRQRAYERVREAKERLARELESAKAQIERQSAGLADEAVRRILAGAEPAQESVGER